MNRMLLAVWLGLGVAGAAFAQAQPSSTDTYVVTRKDGTTVAGYVLRQDGRVVVLRTDTPWKVDDVTIRKDDIESGPVLERQRAREERRRREWRDSGYVEVETPGGPLWVQSDQQVLAQRARAMADTVRGWMEPAASEPVAEAGDSGQAEDAAEATAPAEGPGFLTLWGPQLLLGLLTVVLAGVVAKLLVFS